jgi:hypothetical protein
VKVATFPLNATAVAPVKFVPAITTDVPTTPDEGAKLEIVGAATTVNAVADVAEAAGDVTVIGPVVVPGATVAVICVALFTVNELAGVPLNETAVTPVKFVPVMATEVPTGPLLGVKLVMAGAIWIVNATLDVAVPAGVVTVIMPVLVPEATVAVICVPLLTVKLDAAFPLKATAVAPVKLFPVIATEVPELPETGVKLAIVGIGVVFCGEEEELLVPHANKRSASPKHTSNSAIRPVKTVNVLREAGCSSTCPEVPRIHHTAQSMYYSSISSLHSARVRRY